MSDVKLLPDTPLFKPSIDLRLQTKKQKARGMTTLAGFETESFTFLTWAKKGWRVEGGVETQSSFWTSLFLNLDFVFVFFW